MTQEKVIDIIDTMIEYRLIDPVRALYDKEYLVESVCRYIEAANIAREIMHMPPLV
jgi:hypothetical protein